MSESTDKADKKDPRAMLGVRVTREERSTIKRAALDLDVPASDYILTAIQAFLDFQKKYNSEISTFDKMNTLIREKLDI